MILKKVLKVILEVIIIFDNIIKLKIKITTFYSKNTLIIILKFRNKDIFEIYLDFKNIYIIRILIKLTLYES